MTQTKQPSDFFLFPLPPLGGRQQADDLVVFTPAATVDLDLLVATLRTHLERAMPPERLLLLGADPVADELAAAAEDKRLADVLPEFTRWIDTPAVRPLAFTAAGDIRALGDQPGELSDAGFPAHLLREGLRWIFRERSGMLRSHDGFHYVNPSGRHTKVFIRTANVLLHSAEIAFVAMGLLRWWPPGLRRIFVDTASISSVAYALTALRKLFEPDLDPPTINSFSSYNGVHEFEFLPDKALCLISATTSGGLQREIRENGYLPTERIVTLFYCGAPPENPAQVLCDLTERNGLPGEPLPVSFDHEDECELCRAGSPTVRISGDQFLPAGPNVTDVLLTVRHSPDWLQAFLEDVVGEEIVRCHGAASGDGNRVREINVRLQEVLAAGGAFTEALEHQLKTTVPASLAKIVYVDHPSGKALAERVAEHFRSASDRELGDDFLVSDKQVLRREVDLKAVEGPVMVVTGAMSTGHTLLGVSQFLRNVETVDSIVYLVGVSRAASKAERDRVHSNLTYGPRSSNRPFVAVTSVLLPGEHNIERSPWEAERQFLEELRKQLARQAVEGGQADEGALSAIDARRQELDDAAAQDGSGLSNELFLPRVRRAENGLESGGPLKPREGFVFWRHLPEDIHERATQADVYVTVAAILHRLRTNDAGEAALVQEEHNRTVLTPANFARYNDGVIQAALLRATRPRELDFAHDRTLSIQMRDMVRRFIEHMDEDEGEAAPEFLLAIARGHLKLTHDHTESIYKQLEKMADLPPLMRALRAWIAHRLVERGPAEPTLDDPQAEPSLAAA